MRERTASGLRSAGVLGLLALCLGCGGGGGGGPGSASVTVRGTVQAPGGSLVGPAAEAVLGPVAGATVFAFAMDTHGEPTGPVLAQAVTNAAGEFSFSLPAPGVAFDRVVQATLGAAPATVGAPGVARLNAPLADLEVAVDPTSEAVVRQLLEDAAEMASAATRVHVAPRFTFFTVGEVSSYLHLIRGLVRAEIPVGTTIEQTVQNVNDLLPPAAREWLLALSNPGEESAPPFFGGTYRLVTHSGEMNGNAVFYTAGVGTIVFDPNGTLDVSIQDETVWHNEACGAGMSGCARSFTVGTGSETLAHAGSWTLAPGYRLAVTLVVPSDTYPYVERFSGRGFLSQDGQVVCLTLSNGHVHDLVIGVKQATAIQQESPLSAPGVQAEEVHGDWSLAEHLRSTPPPIDITGNWNGLTSVTSESALTIGTQINVGPFFGPYGFQWVGTSYSVKVAFTCDDGGGSGCAVSGSSSRTVNAFSNAPGELFTIDQGRLVKDDVQGWFSPSARFLVLSERHPGDREMGIGLAIRRGTGLDETRLDGEYSLHGVEDAHRAGAGPSMNYGTMGAVLDFDGLGGVRVTGSASRSQRVSCYMTGACPGVRVTSHGDWFTDEAGTYAVDAAGGVTVTIGDTTLRGQVSEDGFLLMLAARVDLGDESMRDLYLGGKR